MTRPFLTILAVAVLFAVGCASHRAATPPGPPGGTDPRSEYLIAELASLDQKPDEAAARLSRAIELDPKNPYLYYKRALWAASQGRLEEAKADVRRSLELEKGQFDSLVLLAKILQTGQEWEEAASRYEEALAIRPEAADVRYLLIETFVAQKNYKRAEGEIVVWEKMEPEEITPLFYKAAFYQNLLEDPERAVRVYREILRREPDNRRALSSLAEISLTQKRDAEALALFQKMEALDPDDVAVSLKIALIYYESDRFDEAIAKFVELQKKYPESDRITYYLGVIYENVEQDEKAMAEFSRVPASSSFFRDARLHMAYLQRKGGRGAEAVNVLKEAIAIQPATSAFYEYLAEIHREQRQYVQGIEVLLEGIQKSPDQEPLYYSLGVLYERAGNFDESIKAMRKVLQINPDNANALNYIGYSYADRGEKLDEALMLLNKALLLKPEDGYITDSIGWVYFRKGDLEQAFLHIWKAYQTVPEEPTITEHLGDIFLKQRDSEKAEKYFLEAISVLEKEPQKGENERQIGRIREKIETARRANSP